MFGLFDSASARKFVIQVVAVAIAYLILVIAYEVMMSRSHPQPLTPAIYDSQQEKAAPSRNPI